MTLIEKLIAAFISISLTTALLSSIPAINTLGENIDKSLKTHENINVLDSHLKMLIHDLDQHRLPITPLIHKHGEIKYSDNSPTPIFLRNDGLKSLAEADAISWLKLKNSTPYKIFKENEYLKSCNLPLNITNFHALAFTADKVFEVKAIISPTTTGCKSISIIPYAKSLFFNQPIEAEAINRIRLLLPIEQNITLYLAENKTFRYVQFEGEQIKENQPIHDEMTFFKLEQKVYQSPFYQLKLKVSGKTGEVFNMTYQTLLSRKNYSTLILQALRL